MYWKSDPMFVCRLEDKDLPALGGPSEKVRGAASGRTGGEGGRRGASAAPVPAAGAAAAPAASRCRRSPPEPGGRGPRPRGGAPAPGGAPQVPAGRAGAELPALPRARPAAAGR